MSGHVSHHLPGTSRRLAALSLDGIVSGLPWLLIPLLAGGFSFDLSRMDFFVSWTLLGTSWAWMILYQVVFLRLKGATPGKMALGLRVVQAEEPADDALGWGQVLVRVLISNVIPMIVGMIPQLLALVRLDRRQLADLAAGTRVVQDRPRPSPPRKRWVLASVLLVIFLLNAMSTLGQQLRRTRITSEGVHFHLKEDMLASGTE
jgi:uncharacterized RDD family membrane protein YckC